MVGLTAGMLIGRTVGDPADGPVVALSAQGAKLFPVSRRLRRQGGGR
ncbi:hypothetical protein [Streptomyces shenzhenensis]|nr:hypothetical protein [Streptomyces shenzhenensis]